MRPSSRFTTSPAISFGSSKTTITARPIASTRTDPSPTSPAAPHTHGLRTTIRRSDSPPHIVTTPSAFYRRRRFSLPSRPPITITVREHRIIKSRDHTHSAPTTAGSAIGTTPPPLEYVQHFRLHPGNLPVTRLRHEGLSGARLQCSAITWIPPTEIKPLSSPHQAEMESDKAGIGTKVPYHNSTDPCILRIVHMLYVGDLRSIWPV